MTSTKAFYSSTAPEVLSSWEDTQRRYREYHAAAGEFFGRWPNHKGIQSRFSDCVYAAGLHGDESPGEGWRRGKNGDWYPDKRLKAGKALAKELDALKVKGLGHLPGMPSLRFADGVMATHSAQEIDGVMWVTWSIDADEIEKDDQFDGSLWERAKASAYHLAIESVQA